MQHTNVVTAVLLSVGSLAATVAPANAQGQAGPADRAFIDFMTPHHQSAVAMAEDAMANAVHAELRSFAERLRDRQVQEIARMKEWRADWFGSPETPPPTSMRDIPPGPDYDRIWMEEIIRHHQSGNEVAMLARHASTNEAVRELAGQILQEQTADQHRLWGWLQEWYGVTPPPGMRHGGPRP